MALTRQAQMLVIYWQRTDRQVELRSDLFFSPGPESPIDDLGSVHQIWSWLFIGFVESLGKTDKEIEINRDKILSWQTDANIALKKKKQHF